LSGKRTMHTHRLRDHDQSGRLFVQTVNETGPYECGVRNAECGVS
jgi:hypothetical protein